MRIRPLPILAATTALAVGSAGLLFAQTRVADAAPFSGETLVVYRVGDGAAALTNGATAVFLDEVTPGGSLVQSIAAPTAASGANKALTAAGLSTSEGSITRSPNGRYVAFTGYSVAPGTTGPAGASLTASNPATVGRTIGLVDGNGTIDTSTSVTGADVPYIVRSAATTNGTRFWFTGGNGGVLTTNLGQSTATRAAGAADSNLNGVSIAGGQLFVSGASDGDLAQVGTGTPTSGATLTDVAGLPTNFLTFGYAFLDLTSQSFGSTGLDTLYFTDAASLGGVIEKYSYNGTTWTQAGQVPLDFALGLAARAYGDRVDLAVTTPTGLYVLTDPDGADGTEFATTADPTLIRAAVANTEFRGVALAPEPAVGPSILVRTPTVDQSVEGQELTLAVAADVSSPEGVANVWVGVDDGAPVKATKGTGDRWTANVNIGALAAGPHKVKVTATDNADDPATSGAVRSWTYQPLSIPAGRIGPGKWSLVTTPGITKTGFRSVAVSGAPGGNGLRATGRGNVSFTYQGRGLKLVYVVSRDSGQIKITEDGTSSTVSLYSRTTKQVTKSFTGRTWGPHTVTIAAPRTKVPDSRGFTVTLAWIEVIK